jgi:hypothetical protein
LRRSFFFLVRQTKNTHPSHPKFQFHYTLEPHLQDPVWPTQTEVVAEVATTPINAVTGTSRIVVDGYIRMGMHVPNARYLAKNSKCLFTLHLLIATVRPKDYPANVPPFPTNHQRMSTQESPAQICFAALA